MDNEKASNYAPVQGPRDTPINKLPPEILASIMWKVVSLDKETPRRHADEVVLRYPEVLSHVCCHWRQVAIHSHNLWCHINVPMNRPPGKRTMAFLDRAAQTLLNLCLFNAFEEERGDGSFELIPFLAPITSRLKSLELVARPDYWSNIQTSALSACLASCTGANLRVLEISSSYGLEALFFKARDQHKIDVPVGVKWVDLDLDEARLEDILQGVTVLRLIRAYPQWASRAYCGLTELRLLSRVPVTFITEDQIVGILRDNPGLRILHLDLRMTNIIPLDAAIAGLITLPDLEALNLDWAQERHGVDVLLRWFAPCPKLCQLSLHRYVYCMNDLNIGKSSIAAFWAGANITRIHITNLHPTEIGDLVSRCPRVRELACFGFRRITEEVLPIEFHTLYLIECETRLEFLRQLILPGSVQRLVIYRSKIAGTPPLLLPSESSAAFSDLCSDVLILADGDPNPIAHWGASWGWDR